MFNWPRIWRFLFRHRSETAAKVCNADGVPCTNVSVEFCFSIAWVLSKYLYSFTQMEMYFLGRYICTCLNQKTRYWYMQWADMSDQLPTLQKSVVEGDEW
jgi:hypothetical protein